MPAINDATWDKLLPILQSATTDQAPELRAAFELLPAASLLTLKGALVDIEKDRLQDAIDAATAAKATTDIP